MAKEETKEKAGNLENQEMFGTMHRIKYVKQHFPQYFYFVSRMCASSAEDRDLWLDAIRDSIKEHPFYDIIAAKKSALRRKSLRHVQQHDIPTTPTTTPRVTTVSTPRVATLPPSATEQCVQT
jgi:hypothetical protein